MALHAEVAPIAPPKPHEADVRSKVGKLFRQDKRPKYNKLIDPNDHPVKATGDTGIGGVTVVRSELVHGVDTGEAAKKVKFPESRPRETGKDEVDIKGETVERYYNFLNKYVRSLGKLAGLPSPAGGGDNALDFVMQDPDMQADKVLVEELTQQAVASDGTTIARTVNPDRVKDYLQTADGVAEATMSMEQYALWAQVALGIAEAVKPKAFHGQTSGDHKGDKLVLTDDKTTLRNLIKTGSSKALAGIVGGAYLIGGKGRTDLDPELMLDVLQALKKDPALGGAGDTLRVYLREVIGVDIDRINVVVVGGKLQAEYDEGYKPDIPGIRAELKNIYSARKELFNQLGVDAPTKTVGGKEIDRSRNIRTPDEEIFFSQVQPEGLRMRYLMEISTEEGALLKAFGGTPNRYERARLKAQAREKVRARYAERRVKMEQTKKETGAVDAMKKKRDQMVNNPDQFRKDKAEAHNKRKDEATKKKAVAETKKRALTEGDGAVAAKERTVRALESNLIREFGLPLDVDVPSAIAAERKKLETSLTTEQGKLDAELKNKGAAQKTVFDETRKTITDAMDAWKLAVAGAKSRGDPPTFDAAAISAPGLEAVNSTYDALIDRLKAKVEGAENGLANLDRQYKAYLAAVGERESATTELATEQPDQFSKAEAALSTFVVGPPILATEAEVRTRTVDQLVALLPTGTPEEKLELTLTAKATEETFRLVALSNIQLDAVAALTTAGVDYDQFLVVSQRELFDRLHAYHIAVGTVPMPTAADLTSQIDIAQQAAGKTLRTFNESRLNHEITYYDGIIKTEEASLKNLGEFKEPIVELDSGIAIMQEAAEGRTYGRVRQMANATDHTELLKLADVNGVAGDTNYSDAERKLNAEKGIYAWYELLYPEYRNSGDRDKVVESLARILPPDKLSEIIEISYFGAPLLGPPLPPNALLNLLAADIAAGMVTASDMQKVVRALLTHVREHSLAL